jgi:hypothetical protein
LVTTYPNEREIFTQRFCHQPTAINPVGETQDPTFQQHFWIIGTRTTAFIGINNVLYIHMVNDFTDEPGDMAWGNKVIDIFRQ